MPISARIKKFFPPPRFPDHRAAHPAGALHLGRPLVHLLERGARGFVQKFSNKGWICKTWEGELAMVNLPGTISQIFTFTVRDPKVAEQINATLGKRVAMHYDQHRGLPTTCFGDTTYFVTSVQSVEP